MRYRVRDTDAEGRPVGGINYPPADTRAEPGDVVELPEGAAAPLVAQGVLEEAPRAPKTRRSR